MKGDLVVFGDVVRELQKDGLSTKWGLFLK